MNDDQDNIDEQQESAEVAIPFNNQNPTVTHFLALYGSYHARMTSHLEAKNVLKKSDVKNAVAKHPIKDFWGEGIPSTEAIFLSPTAFTVFMMIYGHETEQNESQLTEEWLINKVNYKADISPSTIKNTLKKAEESGLLSKRKGDIDKRNRVYSCKNSLREIIEDSTDDAFNYAGS